VAGFFWSRDSKYILFVKDNEGDENFNVWAVDPAAKAEAGKDAPPRGTSPTPRGSGRRSTPFRRRTPTPSSSA
jgi:hypothetical protein